MEKQPDAKISNGTWFIFAMLAALLLAAVVGLWLAISHGNFPKITAHGWIAMGIGTLFSLLIGCGLMWLSFYSAREGFDERADPGRLPPKKDTSEL